MATSAGIRRNTNRDLAVIAVRALDDAYVTWVAAEVESEHVLRAWSKGPAAHRAAASSHTARLPISSGRSVAALQPKVASIGPLTCASHTDPSTTRFPVADYAFA